MKKNHFIIMVVGIVIGLIFALGMCMCLLPEWNLFVPGVVFTAIGGIGLLVMGIVLYLKNVKQPPKINWDLTWKITYAVVSSLVLGLGMCFIMVWNQIVLGLVIGIVGLIMLLFLIPIFFGFKE